MGFAFFYRHANLPNRHQVPFGPYPCVLLALYTLPMKSLHFDHGYSEMLEILCVRDQFDWLTKDASSLIQHHQGEINVQYHVQSF